MLSLLKSAVLSVGLLAGLPAIANAQSVSALPADGNTPPSYGGTLQVQNAHTGIAGSTQSYYPKPGGGGLWKEDHYQPPAPSVSGAYPSTNQTGLKPH
ncbi:MAG: hypothetical protein JOZ29_14065 [Deltaproteobacteria bacterium]|nr:hypothetical protein [Deltaproteobacteria bacterium]